jgi:hypothetical protein
MIKCPNTSFEGKQASFFPLRERYSYCSLSTNLAKRCLFLRKLFSDSTYSNASYSLVLILQTTDAVYPGHSLGHRNLPKFIESARVIHVTRSGDYFILKQKPPKEEKRNVYKWVLIALDTLTGAGITSCQHIYRTVDSGKQVL